MKNTISKKNGFQKKNGLKVNFYGSKQAKAYKKYVPKQNIFIVLGIYNFGAGSMVRVKGASTYA